MVINLVLIVLKSYCLLGIKLPPQKNSNSIYFLAKLRVSPKSLTFDNLLQWDEFSENFESVSWSNLLGFSRLSRELGLESTESPFINCWRQKIKAWLVLNSLISVSLVLFYTTFTGNPVFHSTLKIKNPDCVIKHTK